MGKAKTLNLESDASLNLKLHTSYLSCPNIKKNICNYFLKALESSGVKYANLVTDLTTVCNFREAYSRFNFESNNCLRFKLIN